MRVKCLAQEHNTMTWPGLNHGPLDPESSALTTRPPRLPLYQSQYQSREKKIIFVAIILLKLVFSIQYVEDNLGVMSVGFLLSSPSDAVIWRGPKKNGKITTFLSGLWVRHYL